MENSSTCNKAKQEDRRVGGMLGSCCESQPNAPLPPLQRLERALTELGILLPEGHPLVLPIVMP